MRPPLIPRLLVPRLPFFYGWVVLACICLAGFARQGPAVATLSVIVISIGVLTGSLWMARNERRRAAEQAAAYREGAAQIAGARP